MDRGTYAAASAGFVQLTQLDIVNNNLANVNTPGFKRQFLIQETQGFDETLASKMDLRDPYAEADHARTPGVSQLRTVTDFSLGSIKNTGNPLDVALRDPNEFFVIDTPEGPQYTKAGNFTLNVEGQLVTHEGLVVMGDGGPLAVNGPGVSISPSGVVRTQDEEVGQLAVVRFEDPTVLERVGGSRFALLEGNPPPTPVDQANLLPQSLEMSNVSAIESIIELISATRGFEMYTKSAQSIDEMNQTAISQIGKRAG